MKVQVCILASTLPVLLVVTIATFPGERLEEALPSVPIVPTKWPVWGTQGTQAAQKAPETQPVAGPVQKQPVGKPGPEISSIFEALLASVTDFRLRTIDALSSMEWTSPYKLLVAGKVNYVTGRPQSLWSNVLVLPNFEVGDRVKFDAEGKIAISSDIVSLRGRSLEGAVLVNAHLRKADSTGAQLAGADFTGADLREAKFECGRVGSSLFGKCAQLEGAILNAARLQGASLDLAQLQGASLGGAQLQGASLFGAQLQGAWLDYAQLQGASLSHVYVWRAKPPAADDAKGALIERPETGPIYFGLDCPLDAKTPCDWSAASFAALKSPIEQQVTGDRRRDEALKQTERIGKRPYTEDRASAKAWVDLEGSSPPAEIYCQGLVEQLKKIGCAAD